MKAPAVDCGRCGRHMGKTATHYVVVETLAVVCGRCLEKPAHAQLFPDCLAKWHDMQDHDLIFATRAGVPYALAHIRDGETT